MAHRPLARYLPRGPYQDKRGAAFLKGMERHGWQTAIGSGPADMTVIWGVRDREKAQGQIVVLEQGYIGNRAHWNSVSKGGGLNGRGIYGPCQDDGKRFHGIAGLKPWHADGYALICGQCDGDMATRGVNLSRFYREAAAACAALGYEVVFRPHPLQPVAPPGVPLAPSGATLAEDLAGAGLAVTWNSNAGVIALLDGVPTVALDRGSMAWGVAAKMIGAERRPRRKWAAHLAWKQWTEDEIARGDAWAALEAA